MNDHIIKASPESHKKGGDDLGKMAGAHLIDGKIFLTIALCSVASVAITFFINYYQKSLGSVVLGH